MASVFVTRLPGGCDYLGDLIENGLVFKMSPSAGGWSLNVIYNGGLDERACLMSGWEISSTSSMA